MKKMVKLMAGVACVLLAGTVAAEDTTVPVWLLITPNVAMRPNKYGDDVPEITGYSTNEFNNIKLAVDEAKPGSTIMLVSDSAFFPQNVFIGKEQLIKIDLNGHTLKRWSAMQSNVWRITFNCPSHAVLSIENGKIEHDLEFVRQSNGTFSVMLGSGLTTCGNINANSGVEVVLGNDFDSDYLGLFSTQAPLCAMRGARFAYQQNPDGATLSSTLKFPSPELGLIEQDGKYVVGEQRIDKVWSFGLSQWMQDFPDNTPISKICVPFSHDSGISQNRSQSYGAAWLLGDGFFITQRHDIAGQLASGCRAFDFRFRVADNGDIRTYHATSADSGFGYMGESLDSIIDAFSKFLGKEENKHDVVFMFLSHWGVSSRSPTESDTQALVLERLTQKLGDYFYRAPETTILNTVQLKDVRRKLVVLVDPAEGSAPLSSTDGFWKSDDLAEPKGGYYNIFDHYSNSDSFDTMKNDQLSKWRQNSSNPLKKAFAIDWTLTAQNTLKEHPKLVWALGIIDGAAILALAYLIAMQFATMGWGTVIMIGLFSLVSAVIGTATTLGLIEFCVASSTLFNVQNFSERTNPVLVSTLNECIESKNPIYGKPTFVSYDFVDEKINHGIIALNADLCPYAAEVYSRDGKYSRSYTDLNEAFKDSNLLATHAGCTNFIVRLLRSEEPSSKYGFGVGPDYNVRLDLNGKFLRSGEYGIFGTDGDYCLLGNGGILEVFNSQPDSGGIIRTYYLGGGPSVANSEGGAVENIGERLVMKDIKIVYTNGPAYAVANRGKVMVLDGVTLEANGGGISQKNGLATYLTNCTIKASYFWRASSPRYPIFAGAGTFEMSGGSIGHSDILDNGNEEAMPYVGGNCRFILWDGEIKRPRIRRGYLSGVYVCHVRDYAQFEVHDGFVGGLSNGLAFDVQGPWAQVRVYKGCFGGNVPEKYIVDGRCNYTERFQVYPYEVVPFGSDGGADVAVAEIVGMPQTYPSVQAAVDEVDPAARQTVRLLQNTYPGVAIVIPKGTGLTLDLNGYRIMNRDSWEPVVRNFGGLTLTDSSPDSSGVVTRRQSDPYDVAPDGVEMPGLIYNAGTFFFEGGRLRDGVAVDGAGVYNETNGICVVSGGVITGCRADETGGGICNRGLLSLRGGEIADCSAGKRGGGIFNDGELTMVDGAIRACAAAKGGGIANCRNALILGGEIADNVSKEDGASGAIFAEEYSETVICGGKIRDTIDFDRKLSGTVRVQVVEGLFGKSLLPAMIHRASVATANVDFDTREAYPIRVRPRAVARVGDRLYATLDEALEHATSGGEVTVTLLSHVRNADTVLPGLCNVALDLAGNRIMGRNAALTLRSDSRLRILDSVGGGTVGCPFATDTAQACSIRNAGICSIEGGRYADPIDNGNTMSVKAGLFSHKPDDEWRLPSSSIVPNDDDLTRYEYPFAVVVKNNASRAKEPTNLLPLQEVLDGNDLTGESLLTVGLAEDSDLVSLTVRKGHRAVLDLRGRRLHGVAHQPVVTVEPGAALTIVDSVGGGMILKENVDHKDLELKGGIVNYGELTLAGGMISNCYGRISGGVYNAPGATFWMSGGCIVDCGTTEADKESAPGVLNAGTFWMTGGEIADCNAAAGVMAVCNLTGGEFNQLGGVISDGFGATLEANESWCVLNLGRYVLVDGQVLELKGRQGESERGCIHNDFYSMSNSAFVQLWGEVAAVEDQTETAVAYSRHLFDDDRGFIFRISNGKIGGEVGFNATAALRYSAGVVSGGFFVNTFHFVETIAEFCSMKRNDDAATKDEYAWRVMPKYEVEVLDSTGAVIDRRTLQDGLDYRDDNGVRLRLVTDVKDCVVCSNAAPVTLDLNGFAITGTGKTFADGFARPVIRNEGTLTVFDSRSDRTGIIAMPSAGTAEEGGAICNHGELCVSNVVIFGTRARRGGGVFNAIGAAADLVNVSLTGCQATDKTSGDLICNEGALTLTDCVLAAWPDARDPDAVRRGLAIATRKGGQTKIANCKVRGQITAEELAGGPIAVTIKSGLFDEEPPEYWVEEPSVCQRNGNEETRYAYRWSVDRGLRVRVYPDWDMIGKWGMHSLYVRFGDGDFELACRLTAGGSWTTRTFDNVPRDAKMTLRASGHHGIVEKTISMSSFPWGNDYVSVIATIDLFFDAKIDGEHFVTVSDALTAANGRVVTLFHNVVGDGHRLPAGKSAVLDLNGYVLRGDGTNSVIVNEGELTLRDSSASGAGMVVRSGDRFPQSGGGVCNLGVFTLESGVIAGCRAVGSGGGIYGSDRSVTYIRGGEIRGCWAEDGPSIYSFGRVEVRGGAICERMDFGKLPPNPDDPTSGWRGASVFLSGGIFGTYPQPSDPADTWLISSAVVVPNDDETTKGNYPYRVVDTLAGDPIYDVMRVDQSYFSDFYPENPTVLQAGRIYRFYTNVTLVGSTTDPTLASALSVTGGTTVLYIDKGVTVALTGSVVRVGKVTYPGAGLRVPEHATVIVTGEGTLLAKGSDPALGANGYGSGGYTGPGGWGGEGGCGMSAAIGGIGGLGGNGGEGSTSSSGSDPKSGEAGHSGESMGRVVALGSVKIITDAESTGASGGSAGPSMGGYNGGGGGGGGGATTFAIGGGGGGGGGGAGGEASGAAYGGFGGQGGIFFGRVGMNASMAGTVMPGDIHGGAGGECGGDGEFYIGDLVSLDCDHLDGGTNRTGRTLNRHDALRRRITVTNNKGSVLGTFEAFVGEPLPEISEDIIKAWGRSSGLYCHRVIADIEEKWYEPDGTPCKSVCEIDYLGDVTLYLQPLKVVAKIEDETLGTREFSTLEAAVAAAKYGSAITIVGDVSGENVKVPIGITILVEPPNGNFRPPEDVDLRHKYYMVTTNYVAGKPCYTYGLNEEMVVPRFDASDDVPVMEFVRDDEGKVMSVKLNVQNVYEDLYYILYWGLSPLPEEMVPVAWECADGDGTIRLEAPADENSGFYRIRVTDHIEGLLW